ncbi:MAG: hypothetical protein FWH41_09700 [Treponema sp.]|nr:hypothetical protein [Treponema sp.]
MITREVELFLQGHQIELSKVTLALTELKETISRKSKYDDLPAWINLDLAAKLKGGCSPDWIKNNLCLQPCCGTNYKLIGGRKCWKSEDVIEWLEIADSDLKEYGKKHRVSIPEKYLRRSA